MRNVDIREGGRDHESFLRKTYHLENEETKQNKRRKHRKKPELLGRRGRGLKD